MSRIVTPQWPRPVNRPSRMPKTKALEIADAAGVELGDLLSINVYGGSNYYPTYYDSAKAAVMLIASVPVSAGTLTITMECNLTYELK